MGRRGETGGVKREGRAELGGEGREERERGQREKGKIRAVSMSPRNREDVLVPCRLGGRAVKRTEGFSFGLEFEMNYTFVWNIE